MVWYLIVSQALWPAAFQEERIERFQNLCIAHSRLHGQDGEGVFHVDDLIEAGTEKIVMPCFLLLFRSHPIPRIVSLQEIIKGPKKES